MKLVNYTIKKGIILGIFILLISNANGQDYTFYGNDTNTFTTTCGKIVGGYWGVKNDSCLFFTPYLHPYSGPGDSVTIAFTIRINQTGNLLPKDNAYIFSHINNNDYWQQEKIFQGVDYTYVHSYSDSVKIARTDSFRIIISLENSSKTCWWQIMSGKMHVNDVWYGDPPLPVELLNFNATVDNNLVLLKWTTASETNNDYFTLEKSGDCIRFEELAVINGAGCSNSLIEYFFSDVFTPQYKFYRLKQTDYDGLFSYSNIIEADEINENNICIFTDNTDHLLNVVADSKECGQLQLIIYNMSGQLIYENDVFIEQGKNIFEFNPQIKSGSNYIVSITINDNNFLIEKLYLN